MRPNLEHERDILEKLVKFDELKPSFSQSDNRVEEKAPQNQLDCKMYIENLLIELVKDIEKYKKKMEFKYPYDLSVEKFNEEQYVEYLKIKGRVIAILAIVTEFIGAYSGKYEVSIKEEMVSPEIEKEREFLDKIKNEFLKDFDVITINIIHRGKIEQILNLYKSYLIAMISTFNEAYEFFVEKIYIFYGDDRIDSLYSGVKKGRTIMGDWRDKLLEKTLKSERGDELKDALDCNKIEHYAICCKYLGLMPKQNLVNHIYYFNRRHFVEFASAPSYYFDQYKKRQQLDIINFDTINELLHKACYEMLKIENIVIDKVKDYILQNEQESGKISAPHR